MTVGLTRDELEQPLDAADADSPRSAALITLLAYNGLRVDEALSRDVEHLGHQQGHRVLRISRKGGRDALEPLSPPVERALDTHLADRTSGALFVDDHGRRMYEAQAWRLVRRLARNAELKSAGQLSPRSSGSSTARWPAFGVSTRHPGPRTERSAPGDKTPPRTTLASTVSRSVARGAA
jgi:integrase/recombinase XerD